MNKFINLLKNEFFKEYKKLSIKIICLVVIVFAFATPFISLLFQKLDNNYYRNDYQHQINYYTSDVKDFEDQYNKNKTDKSAEIRLLDAQNNLELYKTLKDNNISYNDWQKRIYEDIYENNLSIKAYDLIIDKQFTPEDLSRMSTEEIQININTSLNPSEFPTQRDKLKAENDKLNAIINDNNYNEYTKILLDEENSNLESINKQIKSYETELAKNKDDTNTESSLKDAQKSKASSENRIMLYKLRLEKNVNYENDNPYNSMFETCEYNYDEMNATVMTKDEFEDKRDQYGHYSNYEEYKKEKNDSIKSAKEDYHTSLYGIKNDIPKYSYANKNRQILTAIFSFLIVITIICALVAGVIVANEFSKGTIRLLLIRPATRYKIIASKYVVTFVIGLILTVACGIGLTVSSIIVYGAKDLSYPYLQYIGGKVVEVPVILYIIKYTAFCFIGTIFISTLSFFLSTITKSSAVAIALSVGLCAGSSVITLIMANISFLKDIVGYTPFPYIQLQAYLPGSYNMFSRLNTNATYGACLLGLLSIILLGISVSVFKKRDITN